MPKATKKTPSSISMTACTMGDLVNAISAIRELMALKLPAQHSYHVAKLSRLINQELGHFQNSRDVFIREFGEPAILTPQELAAGVVPYHRVKPTCMRAYQERIEELLTIKVSLPWGGIPMVWLLDHPLTPDAIYSLEPFLIHGDV